MDAERAFSGGHLQVGHLQHGMSSQTFKARVALASWVNTPASILEDPKYRRTVGEGKRKGKRKDKEVIIIKAVAPNQSDYIDIDTDWGNFFYFCSYYAPWWAVNMSTTLH